jgi:hypothetical protein
VNALIRLGHGAAFVTTAIIIVVDFGDCPVVAVKSAVIEDSKVGLFRPDEAYMMLACKGSC